MTSKYARRVKNAKPSAIREIIKLTQKPEVISFAGGLPAPELFPIQEMQAVCDRVLKGNGRQALQYGTTEGYIPLRQYIVDKMKKLSVDCCIDNIGIISGSQQGLDLTGKVFLDEGDVVLCESPTYPSAVNSLQPYSPRFIEVSMDDQGMDMQELKLLLEENPRAKLIYTIPDFQNPSGRTMSLERRKQLIELANQFNVIIVEDSPYIDLRFRGKFLPPLKAFDTEGRVVYQGSFSKILVPGLRVGWLCASREVLRKYTIFKQGVDLHTSTFAQMQIANFVETFDLPGHIHNVIEVYKKRCDVMCNSIKREFPAGITYRRPDGGLFMWLELPESMNAAEILQRCLANDVAFVPGHAFFPCGGHYNTLRLNFATMPEEKITEGISRMGKVLKAV
ncbi:MAG: PLP-dependent aminotransferase family protein [Veillonellales bacterium]